MVRAGGQALARLKFERYRGDAMSADERSERVLKYALYAIYALAAPYFTFVALADGRFVDAAVFLLLFTAVSLALWKIPSVVKRAEQSIARIAVSVVYLAAIFYVIPITYEIAIAAPISWVPLRAVWLFPGLLGVMMTFSYLRNRVRPRSE
jgi:hypothetical protein